MTPRSSSSAKRTNDPEAMRRRVLDAAAALFQTRGYHATSTHEIIRQAGVTAGAFHHHFPTKKALGVAVIRERVAPAVERAWIKPVGAAASASEGIAEAFTQIAAGIEEQESVVGCPLNNLAVELSLADEEFRSAVHEVFEQWCSSIANKLREDVSSRVLRADDAQALAAFVVAVYSGAIAMAKASQSSQPIKTCAAVLGRLMQAEGRRPQRRAGHGR